MKGEKAVAGREPVLLTNRKGPVGILVPVTEESLPFLQEEIRKLAALQSLRSTWLAAREAGLDRMPEDEIEREVKAVRRALRAPARKRRKG